MLLTSNASTDIHTNNNLNTFQNNLPQEINVHGYKVSLQSLSLDNKPGNVPNNVLGSKNHFRLYSTQTPSVNNLLAECDISDLTVTPLELSRILNLRLMTDRGFTSKVQGKSIEVTLSKNITLLVSKYVSRWLNFTAGVEIQYEGDSFTALQAPETAEKIFTSAEITTTSKHPRIIKVRLEEVQQNLSSVKQVQDLALVVVKEPVAYPFYHVCRRKEYFALRDAKISNLSFSLLDEDNFPIQLGSGQATFIKIQFKKFPMDSLVLRLSSLESQHIFSDNASNSFRIQLQEPLDLRQNWEVALSSVFLPNAINYTSLLAPNDYFFGFGSGENFKKLDLNDVLEKTSNEIAQECNTRIQTLFAPTNPPINFTTDRDDNLFLKCNITCMITISGMLGYLLSKSTMVDEVVKWSLTKDKNYNFGKIDLNKMRPHIILMYCNFIQPIVVGHTFGQVLQMIPYYNSGEASILKYEAQHLDFISLSMNDKSVLHFELRDSRGELIPFKETDTEILLTLVFRKK